MARTGVHKAPRKFYNPPDPKSAPKGFPESADPEQTGVIVDPER